MQGSGLRRADQRPASVVVAVSVDETAIDGYECRSGSVKRVSVGAQVEALERGCSRLTDKIAIALVPLVPLQRAATGVRRTSDMRRREL
jgi:hypothetical protein